MANVSSVRSLSGHQPPTDRTRQPGPETETFGARLRRLRVTRGLSQTQLAAALNISVPAVSGWEKDRARPRHGRLAALGDLLGVSVAELMGNNDREFSPDFLAECRAQIARIVGTAPEKVRILIEL